MDYLQTTVGSVHVRPVTYDRLGHRTDRTTVRLHRCGTPHPSPVMSCDAATDRGGSELPGRNECSSTKSCPWPYRNRSIIGPMLPIQTIPPGHLPPDIFPSDISHGYCCLNVKTYLWSAMGNQQKF